jgi:hypothetical protein
MPSLIPHSGQDELTIQRSWDVPRRPSPHPLRNPHLYQRLPRHAEALGLPVQTGDHPGGEIDIDAAVFEVGAAGGRGGLSCFAPAELRRMGCLSLRRQNNGLDYGAG